jgi:hypothetical protein
VSDEDILKTLITLHDKQIGQLKIWDAYYEGEQPLSYMHPDLVQQLEGQVRQVVINWPQMVVDALEERLDIEGFRRPDQVSGDDDLWNIWQASDMDAGSQRAHVEALALGHSYVTVGAGDSPDDPPIITDESAVGRYRHHRPADPQDRRRGAPVVVRPGRVAVQTRGHGHPVPARLHG